MPPFCRRNWPVRPAIGADWPGNRSSRPGRMAVWPGSGMPVGWCSCTSGCGSTASARRCRCAPGSASTRGTCSTRAGAAMSAWRSAPSLIIVGALVLLLWIPLRQRPGLGTVSQRRADRRVAERASRLAADVHGLWLRDPGARRSASCSAAVATGMYIGAHYGPGPRDGLMTGLARRTGRSIRLVRTGIEVTVLAGRVGARRHGRGRHRRLRAARSARSRRCS